MEKTIQKSDFYKVSIDAIEVEEGFNVREELEGLDELAKSIATIGQQVPIVAVKVRGEEKFILTAGHRRLAAIKLANKKYDAGITHVNVMVGRPDEQSRTIIMLLDGEGAKRLSNKEMVRGIKRLLEIGVSQKEIIDSLALSKSQAQIYNLVKAAKAPKAVQKMIDEGLISVATVNKLQRHAKNNDELVELVEEAVENAKTAGKEKATAKNARKTTLTDVEKLEAALELADETSAKAALVKSLVNKLKAKASVEDIAKLLK